MVVREHVLLQPCPVPLRRVPSVVRPPFLPSRLSAVCWAVWVSRSLLVFRHRGGPPGTRTRNLRIKSPSRCQLRQRPRGQRAKLRETCTLLSLSGWMVGRAARDADRRRPLVREVFPYPAVWGHGATGRDPRPRPFCSREYVCPIVGHAHDGPSVSASDVRDRLGFGECRRCAFVRVFAFRVVVVDE